MTRLISHTVQGALTSDMFGWHPWWRWADWWGPLAEWGPRAFPPLSSCGPSALSWPGMDRCSPAMPETLKHTHVLHSAATQAHKHTCTKQITSRLALRCGNPHAKHSHFPHAHAQSLINIFFHEYSNPCYTDSWFHKSECAYLCSPQVCWLSMPKKAFVCWGKLWPLLYITWSYEIETQNQQFERQLFF